MSVTRTIRLLALSALVATPAAFAADAKNGEALFTSRQCTTCHAVSKATEAGKIGPSLVGVVGRKAGTVAGLVPATAAIVNSGLTWNASTLDEFLTNPTGKVPGTMMVIALPDAKERADVIAYLNTLK